MKHRNVFAKIAIFFLTVAGLSSCYIRLSDKRIEMFKESFGAGSKTAVNKTFHPGAYRNLCISNSWDKVFVQSDDSVRVEITTSDDVIDLARVELDGNTLVIGYDGHFSRIFSPVHKVVVYGPLPDSLFLRGSGDALLRGIRGDSLFLAASGSGDVTLEPAELAGRLTLLLQGSGDLNVSMLRCGFLAFSNAGSGDAELHGTTEKAQFSKEGSGDVDASSLVAASVEIRKNSGSGTLLYNLSGKTINTEED